AAKYATGEELHPSEFSGGEPTNTLLRNLGFEIVPRKVQLLRDGLEQVLKQYLAARETGKFGKEHDMWKLFSRLQRGLEQLDPVRENAHIKIEWSVGQGRWNKVPWIELMDNRETNSSQHGVYGVFLFQQNMTGVYLTLAQGVTEPRKRLGGR